MDKILFIVNSAAGHGKAGRLWENAEEQVLKRFAKSEAWLTRGRGDASVLIKEAVAKGFSKIVAVGGDGTLGDVVHGFLSLSDLVRKKLMLGFFPAGSGCDFARHVRLSRRLDQILEIVGSVSVRYLDAGRVQYVDGDGAQKERFFINMAAFGLAGDVAHRLEKTGKRWGGKISYLLASWSALIKSRAREIHIVLDGKPLAESRFHSVILANTSSTGGGMRIAPRADAEDGLLDIVCIGDLNRRQLLTQLPKVYWGGHIGFPGIIYQQAKHVEARPLEKEDICLNVDGEALGKLPASFSVLPRSVPFLLP
ncbi:MAG: diacylglycerol kinase family lipid kinase [Elusimicrobia bacterium]|nr:diacylglycerol kinase family lipid kinase [Elusimicrobiota bacterium]